MTADTIPELEVRSLLDVLIPGDDRRWPPASAAVDLDLLYDLLADHSQFATDLARGVFRMAMEQREDVLRDLEATDPLVFGRLLTAVYGAYYGSPAVQPGLRSLSELSPKERSSTVDPELVALVQRTSRGLRRL